MSTGDRRNGMMSDEEKNHYKQVRKDWTENKKHAYTKKISKGTLTFYEMRMSLKDDKKITCEMNVEMRKETTRMYQPF